MTDWVAILERAFENGAKTCGDSGDTGDNRCKPRITNGNSSNVLAPSIACRW
jgi:hypothetical protein